jgi:hypothetical protein
MYLTQRRCRNLSFSSSFLIRFLSAGNATSIKRHVHFLLSRIMMSDLLLGIVHYHHHHYHYHRAAGSIPQSSILLILGPAKRFDSEPLHRSPILTPKIQFGVKCKFHHQPPTGIHSSSLRPNPTPNPPYPPTADQHNAITQYYL